MCILWQIQAAKQVYSYSSLDKLWWSCSAWQIESLETSYGSLDLYMKYYTFSWEATSPLHKIMCDYCLFQELHTAILSIYSILFCIFKLKNEIEAYLYAYNDDFCAHNAVKKLTIASDSIWCLFQGWLFLYL